MSVTAWTVSLVVALTALFWMYAGYPLALAALTRRRMNAGAAPAGEPPRVSVIVPCYNESASIERKLKNLEELDYPRDRLELIVADGASTDDTLAKARAHRPAVAVVSLPQSIGKARTINRVLPETHGDIVVVTDANAWMHREALLKVVEPFRDPRVGAATGSMRQVDRSGNAVAQGGDVYWRVEVFLRTREAQLHSVVGMSGEISAFRRSVFVRPDNAVVDWYRPGGTDDFEMTLWAVRHGLRVAYAPEAHVWEYAPDTLTDLFGQKVRIIVQTIVSVRRNLGVALTSGWYGLTFFSRKALPLLSPWLLLWVIAASAALASRSSVAQVFLAAQAALYALALLGFGPLAGFRLARIANFFVLLNTTVAVAWWNFLRGRDYTIWKPIASSRRA